MKVTLQMIADTVISRIHLNRLGIPDKSHITLIEPTCQQGLWDVN